MQNVILLLLLVTSLSGCSPEAKSPECTRGITWAEEDYMYDTHTILQSLTKEEFQQSTFQPDNRLEGEDVVDNIFWSQVEYLSLSDGFQKWYLGQTAEEWMVWKVWFIGNCERIRETSIEGADELNWSKVNAYYYKPEFDTDYNVPIHKVNQIILIPTGGYLLLSESEYYPGGVNPDGEFKEWGELDLEEIRISVEDAYRISEEAGGRNFEQCTIWAANSIEDRYNGWDIEFFNTQVGYRFKIIINDQTGEYEIINE